MDVYDAPKKEGRVVSEPAHSSPAPIIRGGTTKSTPAPTGTLDESRAKAKAEVEAMKKMAETSKTYRESNIPRPPDGSLNRFQSLQAPPSPAPEGQGINMVSLLLTVVIAAVTLMVGLVVAGNIMNSLPQTSTSSAMTAATQTIADNAGTAFNFVALGMFVLAAVFIIGIVAGTLGGHD